MAERERAYEYGLPEYLQHDLDAYKEGLKNKSDLLDCLWGNCTEALTQQKLMMEQLRGNMQNFCETSICSEENMIGTIDFINYRKILGNASGSFCHYNSYSKFTPSLDFD